MELSRTRAGLRSGATGAIGAVLAGCVACCIPLLAPVMAWLAVAGLGFMGPYGMFGGALGGAAIGLLVYERRRRRLLRQQCACPAAPSGADSCKLEG